LIATKFGALVWISHGVEVIRATNIKAVVVASETVEEKMTIDLLQESQYTV